MMDMSHDYISCLFLVTHHVKDSLDEFGVNKFENNYYSINYLNKTPSLQPNYFGIFTSQN